MYVQVWHHWACWCQCHSSLPAEAPVSLVLDYLHASDHLKRKKDSKPSRTRTSTHIKALRWVALKFDLPVFESLPSQTVSDFLKSKTRIYTFRKIRCYNHAWWSSPQVIKLSFVTFVEIHFCEFSENCYNYAACKRALLRTHYFTTRLRCITYASRKVPFRKVSSLLFETYKQKLLMCFLQCHVSLMRCRSCDVIACSLTFLSWVNVSYIFRIKWRVVGVKKFYSPSHW